MRQSESTPTINVVDLSSWNGFANLDRIIWLSLTRYSTGYSMSDNNVWSYHLLLFYFQYWSNEKSWMVFGRSIFFFWQRPLISIHRSIYIHLLQIFYSSSDRGFNWISDLTFFLRISCWHSYITRRRLLSSLVMHVTVASDKVKKCLRELHVNSSYILVCRSHRRCRNF